MNTFTSLRTAIVQFAFTGVMAPHKRLPVDYAAPRTISEAPKVFV